MRFESAAAGGGDEIPTLVGVEFQRPLEDRPGGGEQKEGGGEVEEELSPPGRPSRYGVFADGEPEVLEGGSQRRFKGLDRDASPVRQIPKQQLDLVRLGVHLSEDAVDDGGDREGGGVFLDRVFDH